MGTTQTDKGFPMPFNCLAGHQATIKKSKTQKNSTHTVGAKIMDKKKCAHYKKKIIIKAQDMNNRKTKVSIQILK